MPPRAPVWRAQIQGRNKHLLIFGRAAGIITRIGSTASSNKKVGVRPSTPTRTGLDERLARFHQRADALGAQHLLHRPPSLKHADLLQVRPERAASRPVREAAIVSEAERLAAMCTLGHDVRSLSSRLVVRHFHLTIPSGARQGRAKGRTQAGAIADDND